MFALLRAALTNRLGKQCPRSLSVVINTLDRAETLARTLESLNRQTHPNFEVIVVNGPSTDSTATLLGRYVKKIKMDTCKDRNLGRSRNIGLDLAAGEIIAFLDDDAEPEPDWLTKLNAAFDMPEVGAAGGFVFDVPLGQIRCRICTCTRAGEATTNALPPISRYLGRGADPFMYLAGCNMSFRRAALTKIGGFNELLTYGYDDVDICCRIIDEGWRIELIEDALVHHHRAANEIRDASHLIRDIYPIIRTRLVFALQNSLESGAWDDAVAGARASADTWRSHAYAQRANGTFSPAECDLFVERVDLALRDGIESGSAPRSFRQISKLTEPLKRFRAEVT